MAAKRVTDISNEYLDENARPASDSDVQRIKRSATILATGKVERDVDKLLATKGLALDETVTEAVREFRKARSTSRKKATPTKKPKKRKAAKRKQARRRASKRPGRAGAKKRRSRPSKKKRL